VFWEHRVAWHVDGCNCVIFAQRATFVSSELHCLLTNFKGVHDSQPLAPLLSQMNQSMPFQPTSIRSILISASHLCLGLQHGIYFHLFPDQFHHWPLCSGQQILAQFTIQTHVLVVRHKRHRAKQCHCNAVFALIFSVKKHIPVTSTNALVTTTVTGLLFNIYLISRKRQNGTVYQQISPHASL
jgi:hypothetical protein